MQNDMRQEDDDERELENESDFFGSSREEFDPESIDDEQENAQNLRKFNFQDLTFKGECSGNISF